MGRNTVSIAPPEKLAIDSKAQLAASYGRSTKLATPTTTKRRPMMSVAPSVNRKSCQRQGWTETMSSRSVPRGVTIVSVLVAPISVWISGSTQPVYR